MVKKNTDNNDDDYTEEPLEEEESDYSYDNSSGNHEEIKEKTTLDRIYNPELVLQSLEKTMRGFHVKGDKWVYLTRPICRDEFINKTINSLRSVINTENMVSKMYAEEVEELLLEKNLEYIDMCEDEPMLDEDDIETVINNYDHALQIFMGLVESGHGAKLLAEISAGVAHESTKEEKKSIMEGIKNVFA